MTNLVIAPLRDLDSRLFERLHAEITEETLYRILKPLADTHAPSQTVSFTRARVLEDLLGQDGFLAHPNVRFERNFESTGNAVLLLGQNARAKEVWLLAHLDNISYFIEPGRDGRYPLTPNCYHLMEPGSRAAVAVGYNLQGRHYEIVARGEIIAEENEETPFFVPNGSVSLRPGMRVCFDSELEWHRETGAIRGSLDDAGGAAALILAARFLANYDIEVMLGLTDEEEGQAGMGSQSICRGGARLLRYFDQPQLAIASDIHEAADMYGGTGPDNFRPGGGASFGEKSARGVGEITPPHLYELQHQMAQELDSVGIRLRENVGGYLSRTEGINAMYRTPNISLIGFLGVNRHFQRDVEIANIKDLVNLAKVVVCTALLVKTSLWKELGFAA